MNGAILRELRQKKGISQNQLAKMLNVDSTLIGKWELYNVMPNITTLNNLCEIFNVTTDYLLGRKTVDQDFIPPSSNEIIAIGKGGKKVIYTISDEEKELALAMLDKLSKSKLEK